MRFPRLAPALLVTVLSGCAGLSEAPPAPRANAVTQAPVEGGRFIALVGPRRQHAAPFLGVPGTNFYALRSWIDTRSGGRLSQLYVEDSYFGGERSYDAANDAQGRKLKFVPISKNEISCGAGCSYAEEFAVELPEPILRDSADGLTVVFTAKSGPELAIAVPGELIAQQLAALDAARPTAAAAPLPR